MSDTHDSGPPAETTYTSDATGLREAADAVIARRGGPVSDEPLAGGTELREVINGQDVAQDAPITARRAAKSLSQYRQAVDAQRAQLDEALGLVVEERNQQQPAGNDRTVATDDAAPVAQPQDFDAAGQDRIIREAYQAQAQAQVEIQNALAAHQQYSAAIQNSLRYVEHAFQREFPEIQTVEDFARLQVTDPMRFEQAREAIMHNHEVIEESLRTQQQTQQYQSAIQQQWVQQQDQMFEQRHPELRDPRVKNEVAALVVKELEGYGLTINDIGEMYHNGRPISLRSAAAQEILLDAVRYRAAKKGVRAATRAPAPQVQRPGTRSGRMTDTESAAESATRAFRGNPTLRNAAAALAARRRGNQ